MNNRPVPSKYWTIGLDIGYSGVKVFSGNTAVCFPSYAIQNNSETRINLGQAEDERSIRYHDSEGDWEVGAIAQNMISVTDTSAGSMAIYGRSRYFSPMFKVIARVGIAAGIRQNRFGDPDGKQIKIQTGLPPKYLKSDTADLKAALTGVHEFSVKFGNSKWENYKIEIKPEDIGVIDQPEGTIFSVSTDSSMRLLPDAKSYFSGRTLVADPGFGTLDLFPMIQGSVNRDNCQTFTEFGMKQILKQTADEIFDRYNFEISIPAMQQYLESGMVIKKDGRKLSKVSFDDILENASKDVCNKAIEKIMEIYNPPLEFDNMIITGGTGAAWSSYIRNSEYFKECDTVKIVSGNQGDQSLPYIFSNARGYYILAFSQYR